ncbi:MAG TPA: CHRD domain-containing protein [Myxococcota bacterium]|nr:CHRD domain-containing protein [Myxococcota bacterium]
MRITPLPRFALPALALALMLSSAAFAETITYTTSLKGSDEVPPNDSKATGTVEAKYDTATMKLSYTVTYSGLSGPATAAHFHGPAKPGENAGPVITLSGKLDSPIKGEATLTKAQAQDLANGMWYLNVHTAAHASGEIRGQLAKK